MHTLKSIDRASFLLCRLLKKSKKRILRGLKRVRENCARPYGTRSYFPPYPALKRWAKLFRPIRGWFLCTSFHCGDAT